MYFCIGNVSVKGTDQESKPDTAKVDPQQAQVLQAQTDAQRAMLLQQQAVAAAQQAAQQQQQVMSAAAQQMAAMQAAQIGLQQQQQAQRKFAIAIFLT